MVRLKTAVTGIALGALAFAPLAVPARASTDSCTLGSPNIVRDVTDCVAYLLAGCNPGGSPNIITDVMECLR